MSTRTGRLLRAVNFAIHALRRSLSDEAHTRTPSLIIEPLEDRLLFANPGAFWVYAPGSSYYCGPFYNGPSCPCPTSPLSNGNMAGYISQGLNISFSPSPESDAPVEYYNGQPVLFNTDLESDGFGTAWSQTRSWSTAVGEGPLGPGWDITDWTHLVDVTQLHQTNNNAPSGTTDTLLAVATGGDQRWFDTSNGTTYTERTGLQDTLVSNGSGYTLYDSEGGATVYGPVTSATDYVGLFQSYTDSGGNTTTATYNGSGQLTDVIRSSGTQKEKWHYSWVTMTDAAGTTVDHVTSVTLSRSNDSGTTYSTVRSVSYAYYGASDAGGDQGYLKSATIKDSSSNVIDVYAYRYYKSGQSGGDPGDMKMVFNPQSYSAAIAAGVDPTTSSDTAVAPYATNNFGYDVSNGNRVTSEVAQGAGCSCSGVAGQGTYTYSYVGSSGFSAGSPPSYNIWQERTTVDTLDSSGLPTSQEVVYTNAYGQPMLDINQQLGSASTATITGNTSTSTETLTTSGTFSLGDVVVVSGSGWAANNGIFEVKSVGSGYIIVDNSTPQSDSTHSINVQKITQQSATYYQYHDSQSQSPPDPETGQLVLQADPSAVSIPMNLTATGYYDASMFGYVSYDYQYADLVDFNTSTGVATYLNTTTGLINTFDAYFGDPNIGWTFNGPAGITANNSSISGATTAPVGSEAGTAR